MKSPMKHSVKNRMKNSVKQWILGPLALVLVLVFALTLTAGQAAASSFGFFVTSYAPDDADAGEGLGFEFEFGSGPVEFEMRISLYDELVTDPNPNIFNVEAIPIDFGINRSFGGGQKTVTPYFGGGITYAIFDFSFDTTTSAGPPRGVDIDPEIGFYGQVGLEFEINQTWKAFAEVIYRQIDAEIEGDDLGLPIDQELSMTGPAFNLGLAVRW